jgi:hypothetical protein
LPLIAGCPPALKAEVRAFIRTRIKDESSVIRRALATRPVGDTPRD